MNQPFSWLETDVVAAAQQLLGCHMVRTINGQEIVVRIVETEAYHQSDAASHSYKGQTPRTEVMFGPAGYLYVYFTYGMHYCMNVVTGPVGEGSAVLIRAVEPLKGVDIVHDNRGGRSGKDMTNGPAKVCQALGIDRAFNGHNLHDKPLQLVQKTRDPDLRIVQTVRVGISQAKDVPWRFYLADNPFVSKR